MEYSELRKEDLMLNNRANNFINTSTSEGRLNREKDSKLYALLAMKARSMSDHVAFLLKTQRTHRTLELRLFVALKFYMTVQGDLPLVRLPTVRTSELGNRSLIIKASVRSCPSCTLLINLE